jgi:hypothetical protein
MALFQFFQQLHQLEEAQEVLQDRLQVQQAVIQLQMEVQVVVKEQLIIQVLVQ